MSDHGDEAREWLEGEHGSELPEFLVEAMMAGFGRARPVWTMEDVQNLEGTRLDFWMAALDDGAAEQGVELGRADKVRFKAWMEAHLQQDEDGDGRSSKKKYVPSEREKADLGAQGFSDPNARALLDLSLLLGRPVGLAEIEGGAYGSPPTAMVGGKPALKGSVPSLDRIIERAIKADSMALVDAHIEGLRDLLAEEDDASKQRMATLIGRWYDKAKRRLGSNNRTLVYLALYRKKYSGRGLPVDYDHELAADVPGTARREDFNTDRCRESEDQSGSSSGSELKALREQTKELVESQQAMSKSLREMMSRFQSLESKVKNAKPGESAKFNGCFNCGEDGHQIADCPKPLKEKFKKDAKQEG